MKTICGMINKKTHYLKYFNAEDIFRNTKYITIIIRIFLIVVFILPLAINAQEKDTTHGNGLNNLKINFNFNFNPDLSNIGYIDKDRFEDTINMEVLYESEPKKEVYKKDFLWIEKVYSEQLGDSISQIIINKSYVQNIADDEKAALTLVLTLVENGCHWEDGTISMDDDKLICIGLTSLGFDYQCSPKHISFLKLWFANDTIALKEIDNCRRFFPGSTIFTTVNFISLKRTGNKIIIFVTKESHNLRIYRSNVWIEEYIFIVKDNTINLQNEGK